MPDKDFVSKALESAKGALASAKKFSASTGDSGTFAPKHTVVSAPGPKKPTSSLADEAASAAEGIKARTDMAKKVIPSMKKGGTVKETGLHLLHKGEEVIPADVMDKATSALGGSKKPKKKLHMSIKPTDDNRFHVMHSYSGGDKTEPMEESTEHAPSSLKELLAHVEKHYSPDEKESESKPPVEKD